MKINIYRCFIITFLIFISIATFAETRNIVDESNSGNCEMMTLSSQGEEVLMNLSQRAAGVDSLRQLSEISQRQRRLVVGELTQERKAELWRVHFEEVKRSHFWTQDQAKIIEHLSDLSQKAHAVGKDSIFHETLVEAPLESLDSLVDAYFTYEERLLLNDLGGDYIVQKQQISSSSGQG